ncbi:MAG: hormogonium polysaccharide biosynthesis protein HpsA [Cyanobacteria bacterium J06623_5]
MSAKKQTPRTPSRSRSDFQRLSRRFMSGLLRSLFFINAFPRYKRAGFVLPTTVLLLLMVSLTVGAMSYRTFSRTSQTIAYREQQVIDGLAAPAIDRAKAKIEFLLTKDAAVADKRPPSSGDLLTALANSASDYTIPGETRVDLDSTTTNDNAWSFEAPDGTTVVYSITIDDLNSGVGIDSALSDKADNFVVRNGPIDTTTPQSNCPVERLAGDGWQLTGQARLAKNFQVDVLAIKGSGPTKTVSAAEYQQVRTASRGNRWGAWFRYDMEVAPGGSFRWNGAIHTEGSLLASASSKNSGAQFVAYMISSEKSCVYDDDSSVIEVSGFVDNDKDGTNDFQGQSIAGTVSREGNNSFFTNGKAHFHTDTTARDNKDANADNHYDDGVETLGSGKDTVNRKNGGSAADVMQDPISIFTEDTFVHIDDSNGEDKWNRVNGNISRIENDDVGAARPFLDDGYRSDNRYGPKPVYNSKNSLKTANGVDLPTPHKSGDTITDNELLTKENSDTQDYGLDGYWERSAADQGLRVIVGQRLELGNMLGWAGADDPLYPPNSDFEVMETSSNSPRRVLKGPAETMQMRSLRDNLAAVQSMAVYHSLDSAGGKYPLACIASTVHPGNQKTLENSRTFDAVTYKAPPINPSDPPVTVNTWKTDFLTGNGTNGLEFSPPAKSLLGVATTTVDGVTVDNLKTGSIDTEWAKALKNLAYFAGDPSGGAPSFPAVQARSASGIVAHPYPYMSMWGDFSILRRILTDYSGTTPLSTADQSSIHTAACTLGMLAHNLDVVEKEAKSILSDNLTEITTVIADATHKSTIDGKATVGEKIEYIGANISPVLTAEEVLAINLYRQVERDRTLGFLKDAASGANICSRSEFDDVPGGITDPQKDALVSVLCEQTSADTPKYPSLYYVFPKFDHSQTGTDDSSNAPAVNHTQPTTEEYISQGGSYSGSYLETVNASIASDSKIYKEANISAIALTPRVRNDWRTPSRSLGAYSDFNFSGPFVAPKDAFDDSADDNPGNVEKNLSQNIIGLGTSGGSTYDFYQTSLLDKAIMDGRELLTVRLMDVDIDLLTNVDSSASSDDVDTAIKVGGKAWIREDSGIVYAFREDAVREDAIVRPYSSQLNNNPKTAWDACKTVKALTAPIPSTPSGTTGYCHMEVLPSNPYDPPLNSQTGISPKPVDMVADPMRRPYGFRLINGKSLNRPTVTGNVQSAGMTFVTDNPVYIKGDFNLHAQKSAADLELALLEEFKGAGQLLGTEFAKYKNTDEDKARKLFYGRTTLDDRFARPNDDNWRPVEVFADATTMLSNIFLDGWIEDYFVNSSKNSDGDRGKPRKNSSFLNANRPWFSSGDSGEYVSSRWQHEDVSDFNTPVFVDRNGKTYRQQSSGAGAYQVFPKDSGGQNISFYVKTDTGIDPVGSNKKHLYIARQVQQPTPEKTTGSTPKAPVRINALLIGGIVPARQGQSYGGLHNFPRLLEFWPGRQLVISGGFFQLNFSSQAVAPYDQDASWEAGSPIYSGEGQNEIKVGSYKTGNQHSSTFYYGAAERIWGYDVAFQYSPAAPIARRFVRLDRPRSEFYRELPVDDPYIQKLCAAAGGGC